MKFEMPDELMFLRNRKAVQHVTDARLDGKVCIVTGATAGVGLAVVRRMAKAGAHIVMVCRNAQKAEALRNHLAADYHVPVDVLTADFSRLEQVRAAADTILAQYPRIDVLIQSAPSRIIQVNSEGHRFGGLDADDLNWEKRHYTGLKGYGASKTAQLLTVWEFARRLAGTGVTINAMHPGDVKTDIGSNNGRIYRWFSRHVTARFLKDASISGEALHYLAAEPALKDVSGLFFHLTVEEKPAAHALDDQVGKRIWALSLQMTGEAPPPSA